MQIDYNVSLKNFNTFGIDVKADKVITITSENDIKELIQGRMIAHGQYLVLGGGSNMVFTSDFHGVVVRMANKGIKTISVNGNEVMVEAQAGEVWSDFVWHCINKDYCGVENLAGIPGTVGASPVQNVGAYGVEAKDIIHLVRAYDIKTGELKVFNNTDCRFGYRNSVFKQTLKDRYIVASVIFKLSIDAQPNLEYRALANAVGMKGYRNPTPRQVAETVEEVRDSKLPNPNQIGSAGSFFKNPVVTISVRDTLLRRYPNLVSYEYDDSHYKLAAGWLIEQSGWKGKSLGKAGVYEKQALVLVNRGGCTGREVYTLAKAIMADVEDKFGVRLEPEAIII